MSAKHTPGAWDVYVGATQAEVHAGGRIVARVSTRETLAVGETEIADARFISAAPRMFSVIEKGAAAGDTECISIVKAVYGYTGVTA